MRKALAVFLGMLSGAILMSLVQSLGHILYPEPSWLDPSDMVSLAKYVENAPFMALFFVVISYAVAAVLAGFVSSIIAGDRKRVWPLICGILFLIQALFMMSSLPTPVWFWILGIGVWTLVELGYRLALYTMDKKEHSRIE